MVCPLILHMKTFIKRLKPVRPTVVVFFTLTAEVLRFKPGSSKHSQHQSWSCVLEMIHAYVPLSRITDGGGTEVLDNHFM